MTHSVNSPTSFSESLAVKPKVETFFSSSYDFAVELIHSKAFQYSAAIASIAGVTFLLAPTPIGWIAAALAVVAIAAVIFFSPEKYPGEEVVEGVKRPFLSRNQTFVYEKKEVEWFPSHMRLRDTKPDGNCFYSSFAVSVLEWIYDHRNDSSFSLNGFEEIICKSLIEEGLRKSVLEVVDKIKKARNRTDLEDIVRADENIYPLIVFFRELAAQELEKLPQDEKTALCESFRSDLYGDSPQGSSGLWGWVFSIFFKDSSNSNSPVPFSDIVKSVRKADNVQGSGWAVQQTITALSERIPLPFLVWQNNPALCRSGMERSRVGKTWEPLPIEYAGYRILRVNVDRSQEHPFPLNLFYTGGHYQVLYGLTQKEADSRCVVLK